MPNLLVPILILAGALMLAGCESPASTGPHQLPYRMKFDLADVGASYQFKVKVTKPGMYAVSATFYTRHLNEYSHLLDRDTTTEESAHLFKMMGSQFDALSRKWTEIGMPATFRVQLIRDSDSDKLFDLLITRQPTHGTFKGRTAKLVQHQLPPGTYTVRVSYLDAICALFPLKGVISFSNTLPPK